MLYFKTMKRGFTLIELMIVVSILGILAAIVLPHFQSHQQQARQAAAKDTLRSARGQIQLYKLEHNGLAPGFRGTTPIDAAVTLVNQFVGTTRLDGMASPSRTPSAGYPFGPYLDRMPVNPFNGLSTVKYVAAATEFSAAADNATGWLYKRETGDFRLNKRDNDPEGVAYVDY
ncbi:MAG: type II secretion system protein [Phycisphaerae bacterium]|nr:type II secretion system protein [Phycisphaerae bacterium]